MRGNLVAILMVVTGSGCRGGSAAPAAQERMAPGGGGEGVVARGELEERLLLTGRLQAVSSVPLVTPRTSAWQVSVRWMAEDGAVVAKGERVVELDNSAFKGELEQRRVIAKQTALDAAISAALAARSNADKRHDVAKQRLLLERARLLAEVPKDLVAARSFEERQLELERVKVALGRAEEELQTRTRATTLEAQVKQIALDKAERAIQTTTESLGALVLTAPRDGTVSLADHPWERRRLRVGDSMQPGWTIATFPDLAAMEVVATLSDVDDGRIALGDRVVCVLDAYPELSFPGKVVEVSLVAREAERLSLRRAFDVKIALDHSDAQRMRPGMSVKVEHRRPHPAALLVPRAAVVVGAGPAVVHAADGASLPVVLGPCDAQRCVVTEGLSEGQRVRLGGGGR